MLPPNHVLEDLASAEGVSPDRLRDAAARRLRGGARLARARRAHARVRGGRRAAHQGEREHRDLGTVVHAGGRVGQGRRRGGRGRGRGDGPVHRRRCPSHPCRGARARGRAGGHRAGVRGRGGGGRAGRAVADDRRLDDRRGPAAGGRGRGLPDGARVDHPRPDRVGRRRAPAHRDRVARRGAARVLDARQSRREPVLRALRRGARHLPHARRRALAGRLAAPGMSRRRR